MGSNCHFETSPSTTYQEKQSGPSIIHQEKTLVFIKEKFALIKIFILLEPRTV